MTCVAFLSGSAWVAQHAQQRYNSQPVRHHPKRTTLRTQTVSSTGFMAGSACCSSRVSASTKEWDMEWDMQRSMQRRCHFARACMQGR